MDSLTAPVPQTELTKLIPASQAYEICKSAELYHKLETIAYQINTGVNTGEYEVSHEGIIPDPIKSLLIDNGYDVTYKQSDSGNFVAIISCKPKE